VLDAPLQPLSCAEEFPVFPARYDAIPRNELTADGIESRGVSGQRRNGSSSFSFLLDSGAGATLVELRMRRTQTILRSANQDTYLVLDDFGGNLGRVWRETAEGDASREMLIHDLMDGQYSRPARIVAFNTAERWSRDVTVDIADEVRRRFAEYDDVPVSVKEFLELARR
jgi:hypothetical protein